MKGDEISRDDMRGLLRGLDGVSPKRVGFAAREVLSRHPSFLRRFERWLGGAIPEDAPRDPDLRVGILADRITELAEQSKEHCALLGQWLLDLHESDSIKEAVIERHLPRAEAVASALRAAEASVGLLNESIGAGMDERAALSPAIYFASAIDSLVRAQAALLEPWGPDVLLLALGHLFDGVLSDGAGQAFDSLCRSLGFRATPERFDAFVHVLARRSRKGGPSRWRQVVAERPGDFHTTWLRPAITRQAKRIREREQRLRPRPSKPLPGVALGREQPPTLMAPEPTSDAERDLVALRDRCIESGCTSRQASAVIAGSFGRGELARWARSEGFTYSTARTHWERAKTKLRPHRSRFLPS